MAALISLLTILTLSLAVTRIATVALVHTGLSDSTARFQARSAFLGVGYTTSEAENIVNHPVRRQIVMILMFLGNAGFVSALASLLLTFINTDSDGFAWYYRTGALLAGLGLLWLIARSKRVEAWSSAWISKALNRWTDIEARDYSSLLHLSDNYDIQEMAVREGEWLADRSLRELALAKEGVIVFGIRHSDGAYVGAPDGETVLEPGDLLLVYGRQPTLAELDKRTRGTQGDQAHAQAVAEQDEIVQRQQEREAIRQTRRN